MATLSVAIVGVAVGTLAGQTGVLSAVQHRWDDSLQPALSPRTDVVVVAIDRATLQSSGESWPWPRQRLAQLLDRIASGQPKVVALDLLLADPREGDDPLTAALAREPTVLASALTLQLRKHRDPLITAEVPPVESLASVAAAVGHTNVLASDAGIVRHIAIVATTDRGVLRPSLALAAVAVADGASTVVTARRTGVQVGGRLVPSVDGRLEIAFSDGLTPETAVSAKDLLSGAVDPATLSGKIVVVGVTEPTLGDLHATPVDRHGTTSGVFVLANAINTIATAGYLRDAPSASQWSLLCLAVVVTSVAVGRRWLLAGLVSGAAVVAGVLLFTSWRFARAGEHWDVVGPAAGVTAAVLAGASWRYATEVRHRRRAWRLFASYVPPAAVAELEDPAALRRAVDGSRTEATVLFCDLRGFTSIAAATEPAKVRQLLDEYYTTAVDEIHRHQGTVVQFVGDEVFAVWGVPVADGEHSRHAVECAIALQRAQRALGSRLAARGLPEIEYGIGVHTGEVVSAHVGTEERRQYAVVGDVVNVSSRLCSSAAAGELLASVAVVDHLPEALASLFGPLRSIRVKGIDSPVGVRSAVPGSPMQPMP